MAHSASAKKRIRQNIARRALNRWRKQKYRSAIRDYRETVLHGTVEQAETQLVALYRLLDKVAAAGTIHKNTAARYKSRLTAYLNARKAPSAA